MQTATDRLANPTDNRVEILDHNPATGWVSVRYIESGVRSAIHASHLTDFAGAADERSKAGPIKAVPGAEKIDGRSVAHTQTVRPGMVVLFVTFMNGKRRDVGYYPTHVAARESYFAGTYGF